MSKELGNLYINICMALPVRKLWPRHCWGCDAPTLLQVCIEFRTGQLVYYYMYGSACKKALVEALLGMRRSYIAAGTH